eukprot:gnl/Dysnectes_brevis/1750_a1997_1087.p1 GENE.gnl/Dysnectes_brevis/1750_a1997_1087~~gnl/Dysnectes_brevis/1750_a1997_1087.p1  ORF type:complete len:392 (+),score=83.39 gnl/Dysnectes_brevis/1750_a1997_1087:79-1254(+)
MNDRDIGERIQYAIDTHNVTSLAEIAKTHGLINENYRIQAYQILLGVTMPSDPMFDLTIHSEAEHHTITVDVERSLFHLSPYQIKQERNRLRQLIVASLNVASSSLPQRPHYYQGLHDIASSFLSLFPSLSLPQLSFLLGSTLHSRLWAFIQQDMEHARQLLNAISPLIRECYPNLHRRMTQEQIEPDLWISWLSTWLIHETGIQSDIWPILIDYFVASSHMGGVYVVLAAIGAELPRLMRLGTADAQLFLGLRMIIGASDPSREEELKQRGVTLADVKHDNHTFKDFIHSLLCSAASLSSQFPPASLPPAEWAALHPPLGYGLGWSGHMAPPAITLPSSKDGDSVSTTATNVGLDVVSPDTSPQSGASASPQTPLQACWENFGKTIITPK